MQTKTRSRISVSPEGLNASGNNRFRAVQVWFARVVRPIVFIWIIWQSAQVYEFSLSGVNLLRNFFGMLAPQAHRGYFLQSLQIHCFSSLSLNLLRVPLGILILQSRHGAYSQFLHMKAFLSSMFWGSKLLCHLLLLDLKSTPERYP